MRRSGYSRKFIALRTLNGIVKNKYSPMIARLEDENVLKFRLFVMQDAVDFEGHGLAWPQATNLSKPAIWMRRQQGVYRKVRCQDTEESRPSCERGWLTFDGRVRDFGHVRLACRRGQEGAFMEMLMMSVVNKILDESAKSRRGG